MKYLPLIFVPQLPPPKPIGVIGLLGVLPDAFCASVSQYMYKASHFSAFYRASPLCHIYSPVLHLIFWCLIYLDDLGYQCLQDTLTEVDVLGLAVCPQTW